MFSNQTQLLERVATLDDVTANAILGIDKIIEGGSFENVTDAQIVEGFANLKELIIAQRKFILAFTENTLSTMDTLDEIEADLKADDSQ